MSLNLNQKTYFIITGASRGIGQTMAVHFAEKLGNGSVVVLLARDKKGLEKTKSVIEKNGSGSGKVVKVLTYSLDLAQAKNTDFQKIFNDSLESTGEDIKSFDHAIIIHNAGTVGDVSKRSVEVSDTTIWANYYHINVFSVISLNCEFFRVFNCIPKIVVNISSKCGIEPFASMSFYCSGKAARDMYFRVLAVEENQNALVLNYAPGAVDTDMSMLVQNTTIDTKLSAEFKQLREMKTILTTEKTTKKCIQLLEESKFKSGDHVDYWD